MDSLVGQPQSHLLLIPSDVLNHYILKVLNLSGIVACSLVCSHLRKRASSRLSQMPEAKRNQNVILQDIFENGWSNLLSWFQARLRYPSLADLCSLQPALFKQCLYEAAQGDLVYFIFRYIF